MFLNIILTLLLLSVLILSHEFGHFITARLFGVRIEEFAIGMGPKVLGHQGKETLYSLRLLPIGGYCKMQGETDGENDELSPEERADLNPEQDYSTKPAWQRIIILSAGVLMNFFLGLVLVLLAFLVAGRSPVDAFGRAFSVFGQLFFIIFQSIGMLFGGQAGINDLAGPVGMVSLVGQAYNEGFSFMLLFAALLSVNIGILNLLPVPALDGGQIAMLLIEQIRRKEISRHLKEGMMLISYTLLMGLAIYVAYNDIMKLLF